jgi:hypothetical protein
VSVQQDGVAYQGCAGTEADDPRQQERVPGCARTTEVQEQYAEQQIKVTGQEASQGVLSPKRLRIRSARPTIPASDRPTPSMVNDASVSVVLNSGCARVVRPVTRPVLSTIR